MSTTLLALSPAETKARVLELGGKAFHAKVLRTAVFEKGVRDYDELTSLSAELRRKLSAELPLFSGHEAARSVAPDETTKLLIEFPATPDQPPASIEIVHIPSRRQGRGATLCISTQVGCPVACPFCASGRLGLQRNLTRAEILEEFLRGASLGPLARVVVMGIGEPLLNLAELLPALDAVHDELGIGARKITVSTVGFPDRRHKLARSRDGGPRFQLAISLHSPFDEERAELVPAMSNVPIEDVLAAGDDWFRQTGREITYEYVLLGGLNDTERHALELAHRLRGRRATVNLIPYNPVEGDRFQRPQKTNVNAFADDLSDHGIVATVRWSRGLEADAACGQLRLQAAH
jgi:23S rRNA (adenine2503-C2)-methyltransferase